MPTPYSERNQQFSDAAHIAARSMIYPHIFDGCEEITFETTSLGKSEKSTILDGEMAIDRIVRAHSSFLKRPVEVTVQERFRRPRFARFRDLTITEWNHKYNLPSELYKLNAGLFVYGYFDIAQNLFADWIAVSTADTIRKIASKQLPYDRRRNPRSDQTFIVIKFDALREAGVVVAGMDDYALRRSG